ncbi:hypothetical protein DRO69_00490 [Candidatus Bathyarchaeota archaeon]|nr:MAG: hypothetical protein DRO69_00490 [Candidatus Bathyarchaeota archaeon]
MSIESQNIFSNTVSLLYHILSHLCYTYCITNVAYFVFFIVGGLPRKGRNFLITLATRIFEEVLKMVKKSRGTPIAFYTDEKE